MRKTLMSALIAGAAVTVATPASAQGMRSHYGGPGREIQQDINQLDNQITRATQRRTISYREAASLRRQTMQLQRSYFQFSRDGLDRREVAILTGGVNQVRAHLRLERRDWDRRAY